MRQAIVIENPKWEPFTKASDAFSKAKAPAILVVRGRSKEKRVAGDKKFAVKGKPETAEALAADLKKSGAKPEEIEKAVKAFKPAKAVALALMFFMSAFAATAQQSLINNLTNTTYAGVTTNNSIGAGLLGWNIDKTAVIQCTLVGTNANASNNVVLTFETSDNGTDWVPSLYPVVVDANGTTAATQITRITNSTGGKWLRPYSLANSNATAVTIQRFTWSVKD